MDVCTLAKEASHSPSAERLQYPRSSSCCSHTMPRRVNSQGPLRAVLTQCQDELEHDPPEKTHRSHKIRQYFKFLTTVGIMHETQKVIKWKKVLRSLYTTLFQCYTDNTLNSMEVDLVVPISIIAVGAASLEP